MYKLKPNVADFEIVDGAFAGRKYEAGKTYHIVPPEEAYKFVINENPPPLSPSEGGQNLSPAGGGAGGGNKEDNNQ